jgi:hypothetical protein
MPLNWGVSKTLTMSERLFAPKETLKNVTWASQFGHFRTLMVLGRRQKLARWH